MIAALLALALAQPGYYTPQEAQAVFAQANDDYYAQHYAKAKDGYKKLLDHGFGGPDVLFNLGTNCLQAGQLGEAVLDVVQRQRRNVGEAHCGTPAWYLRWMRPAMSAMSASFGWRPSRSWTLCW